MSSRNGNPSLGKTELETRVETCPSCRFRGDGFCLMSKQYARTDRTDASGCSNIIVRQSKRHRAAPV